MLYDASNEADRIKKHADLAAKAEQLSLREAFEKETQEIRQELRQHEKRLSKREDAIDRKADLMGKKEKYVDNTERELSVRQKHLSDKEQELEKLLQEEKEQLHRVSELSREEAAQILMKRLEDEMQHECDALTHKMIERARSRPIARPGKSCPRLFSAAR